MDILFWIRILSPVLVLVIGILKWGLPKVWYDKRTIKFRAVRKAVNLLLVFSAIATAAIYITDYRQIETQSLQLDSMNKKLDSVITLFQPLQMIAQEMFPDTVPPAAIEMLTTKIERELQLAEQRILDSTSRMFRRLAYIPNTIEVIEPLIDTLSALINTPNWPITKILIVCQEGNSERLSLARDLRDSFERSGYSTPPLRTETVLGRSGTGSVRMTYSPASRNAALQTLVAISTVIGLTADTIPVESNHPNLITIEVFGMPTYDSLGNLNLK